MSDSAADFSSYYDGGEEGTAPVWIVVLINIILCVVTVAGNAMVILAYIRDEKIRRTVAYTIILNLSITDILVGIFIFPLNTLWWINDSWAYGTIPCKLWLVLDYSVLSMSTFTIVYISLDRYWLLSKGLEYQSFQTMRKTLIVLFAAWVITILIYMFIAFIYPVLGIEDEIEFYPEDCELEVGESEWFNIFELVIQFIIPFSALVFLNLNVYRKVRERAQRLVSISYDISDPSGVATNSRDDISGGREMSTTNMETKQPSETIELREKEKDAISSNSLSIVSLENENPDETTTTSANNGDTHVPILPSVPTKAVSYSPLTESEPPTETSEDVRLEPAKPNKHEAPVEKRRRKSNFRREKSEFKRYRKAAITLASLVTVFCICWLPYYICAIIRSICEDCISDRVYEIVSYFQWCNSTINPFIYGFTNLLFRRNFVRFMHLEKCLKKTHVHSGSSAY